MNIRRNNKDQLPLLSVPPALVFSKDDESSEDKDGFEFWTHHKDKPDKIDVSEFAAGNSSARHNWTKNFTGRPGLISEILPEIRRKYAYAPKQTCASLISSLRRWWRLFDEIEQSSDAFSRPENRLDSAKDLGPIYNQHAIEDGMDTNSFHTFLSLANSARKDLGLGSLNWIAPEVSKSYRQLPAQKDVALIWHALKRLWYNCVHRWEKAEELLKNGAETPDDQNLLKNYTWFKKVEQIKVVEGIPFPSSNDLRKAFIHAAFKRAGYSIEKLYGGFYPNPQDIKAAFHLCLATTGFNPQVLLDLRVDIEAEASDRTPFLRTNPRDDSRFVMYGQKNRGKSIQKTDGLWKTVSSSGAIIKILVARTWPIRQKLLLDLAETRQRYAQQKERGAPIDELNQTYKLMKEFEYGVQSVWIHRCKTGANWLHASNFRNRNNSVGFLDEVVDNINKKRPFEPAVPTIDATDFRDAFAYFAYRRRGGQIVDVMRALGHKHIRSSESYTNNNLLSKETREKYREFSRTLWDGIRDHSRLDMTIVAKISQDGDITQIEKTRLEEFRKLKMTRIGARCKDPTNPPAYIDKTFISNGQRMCATQRCILCLENAVILPESIDGISMRYAELIYLRSNMSAHAFLSSSFTEELQNTEKVLQCFDESEVAWRLESWKNKIDTREHRVIEFFDFSQ